MSKVCDCNGFEKAYLTINPDSVDRKEILSLNPPICREEKQNLLLVDDEILVRELEIASWNIQPLTNVITQYVGSVLFDVVPYRPNPPNRFQKPPYKWTWSVVAFGFNTAGGTATNFYWRFADQFNPNVPYTNQRFWGLWIKATSGQRVRQLPSYRLQDQGCSKSNY